MPLLLYKQHIYCLILVEYGHKVNSPLIEDNVQE